MATAMSSTTSHTPNVAPPAFDNNNVGHAQSRAMPKGASKGPIFPLNFKFSWEDIAFVARLTNDTKNNGLVTITSTIGWLPFSAENNRLRGLALEFFNQQVTPLTGRFSITPNGQVNFTQITKIPSMDSRREVIQALSICLLQARPYLKTVQGSLIPA